MQFDTLQRQIRGNVLTGSIDTRLVSTDGSIFCINPAAVVYPAESADVVATVRFAAANGLTIHPRGAGSGLCGAALGNGIVIDFSRYMNQLIALDLNQKWFVCQPGYRMGELEVRLAGTGLFFPPDPSSGEYATFGGMTGTNASGAHSVKYGNVSDYILDAQVVWSDGMVSMLSDVFNMPHDSLPPHFKQVVDLVEKNRQIIEIAYPAVPCNTAGYNLRGMIVNGHLDMRRLLTGSEGTLGVITQLQFRLLEKPEYDSLVVALFPDLLSAAKAVQDILPMKPSGIEIMDKSLLNLARDNSPALKKEVPGDVAAILLIEFDAETQEAAEEMAQKAQQRIHEALISGESFLAITQAQKDRFWAVRKAAVPILYRLKGERKILALIEDAAVPTDRLLPYLKGLYDLLDGRGVPFVIYGHIAKGLLHTRPLLNLKNDRDIRLMKILADGLCDLVHSLGGTVSGEHGDGRLRSAYLKKQYPLIYPLFLEIKRLLDPKYMMNPDIITYHDPNQMMKALRFGNDYQAQDLNRHELDWKEPFLEEVEKCHGCSKCTTVTNATRMCPIYKFTREEAASPKAKANLLRALVSGVFSEKNLYEKAFQSVINRCINCGSCQRECPSEVNIPKLVLEAKAAYVNRFCASFPDRLITQIETAGQTAMVLPHVINRLVSMPVVRKIQDAILGVSKDRNPVQFTNRPFFKQVNPVSGQGAIQILYFTGCFTAYIRPAVGVACVRVLTHMGFTVHTPIQHCCGLPMLSKGMVSQARKKVEQNIRQWGQMVASMDYIVVTCSSCGLSLMREWQDVLDSRLIQAIQAKTIHISALINLYSSRLSFPPRSTSVQMAYHEPCHLKIQANPESSINLLSDIQGVDLTVLKSNCCGMAGTWGAMTRHVELSRKIGSDLTDRLWASGAAAIVTDCPTCTLQIEELSQIPVHHPVEVAASRLFNCSGEAYGQNADCRISKAIGHEVDGV